MAKTKKKKVDFNFYDQILAMSFQTPTGNESDQELQSDFQMHGDGEMLINGLIALMERHNQLAVVITEAAYNYMVRNGKPGPLDDLQQN